jgi:hypothetical protein
MPPAGPLRGEQTVKAWIDPGADWPEALSGDIPPPPPDPIVTRMMHALHDGDRKRSGRLLTRMRGR